MVFDGSPHPRNNSLRALQKPQHLGQFKSKWMTSQGCHALRMNPHAQRPPGHLGSCLGADFSCVRLPPRFSFDRERHRQLTVMMSDGTLSDGTVPMEPTRRSQLGAW